MFWKHFQNQINLCAFFLGVPRFGGSGFPLQSFCSFLTKRISTAIPNADGWHITIPSILNNFDAKAERLGLGVISDFEIRFFKTH